MPNSSGRRVFPTKASVIIALLVCVVLPTLFLVLHIAENPELSPIDEAAHYDYITRIEHGGFPRLGQKLQPSTLRLIACTGTDLPGLVVPKCGSKLKASDFPGGGLQYEAQQPPAYYALTVPLRWVAVDVLGFGRLVGTRATGIVWLDVGLGMLFAAASLAGMPIRRIGLAILLLDVSPVVIYYNSTISNDAACVFAAGLVLLACTLQWTRPARWGPVALFLIGLFVPLLKLNDALVVAAVAGALALLIAAREPDHGGGRRGRRLARSRAVRLWLSTGGAMVAGSALSVAAWVVVFRQLELVNPATLVAFDVLRGGDVNLALIANEAMSMLAPLTDAFARLHQGAVTGFLSASVSTNIEAIFSRVLMYVTVAGGAAAVFVKQRRWYHWLGALSIPLLFIGGIVLGEAVYLTYRANPGLSGRYGLSLAPFLVLAAAGSLRGRWAEAWLWVFAIGFAAVDVLVLLGA